jgi:hypothetical protein
MKGFFFFFLLIIIAVFSYWEYQAVKSYFPNMTLFEYFILGDKIRITPRD